MRRGAAYVFVSYVSEDRALVDQLVKALKRGSVNVWLDRERIGPGEIWPDVVRAAIPNGSLFLACFSKRYIERIRSFANYELAEAIEEWDKRLPGRPWIIPVLLDIDIDALPDIPLGRNRRLSHVNAVKLIGDWDKGIEDLIRAARQQDAVAEEIPTLAAEEARRVIDELASERRLSLRTFVSAPPSPRIGTLAYRMVETDGKGVVYCHANGPLRSRAFHIRKGIGWYYEHLGGSGSALGLPIGDEERIAPKSFVTCHFEDGYIEWSPKTKVARAVQYTPQGDRTLDDHKL